MICPPFNSVKPRCRLIQCRGKLVSKGAQRNGGILGLNGCWWSNAELEWVYCLKYFTQRGPVSRTVSCPIPSAPLGSPRASGGAVGLDAGCLGIAVRLAVDNVVRIRQRSLAHSPHSLAPARSLAILLIRGEVERDEEEEVRAEDADPRESSKFLASTLPGIGHPRPVRRREIGVRREVHEA